MISCSTRSIIYQAIIPSEAHVLLFDITNYLVAWVCSPPRLCTEWYSTLKKNKHDKSSRSPGLSDIFCGNAVHTLCLEQLLGCLIQPLYTIRFQCTLFVLSSWSIPGARQALVEVSLTILKTGDRMNERMNERMKDSGVYRVRPGLKIIFWFFSH